MTLRRRCWWFYKELQCRWYQLQFQWICLLRVIRPLLPDLAKDGLIVLMENFHAKIRDKIAENEAIIQLNQLVEDFDKCNPGFDCLRREVAYELSSNYDSYIRMSCSEALQRAYAKVLKRAITDA